MRTENINETKELRIKLEEDIENLINEFHKVSPLVVKDIKYSLSKYYSDAYLASVSVLPIVSVILDSI